MDSSKTDVLPANTRSPLDADLAPRVLIVAGILLRLVQLFARRPLWLDESSLALNLLTRRLTTVVSGGLDFHESAPPLFIAWEWAVARLFGPDEIALRLLPFAAGVGLLFVVKRLAAFVGDRTAAIWAVAAVSISPVLIYYGNEAKQYSVDAFVTAALLLIALPSIEGRGPARPRTLLFAGILAIGFSSAAIMSLGAIVVALFLSHPARTSARRRREVSGIAAAWIAGFLLVYELCYRDYARDPYNLRYWTTAFVDVRRPGALRRAWEAIVQVCGSFFITGAAFRGSSLATAAILALAVVGFLVFVRRRGVAVACAFGGAVLAPVVLSAFGRLPITPRVMLFAAAPLFLAIGLGLSALIRIPSRGRTMLAIGLFGISLYRPALLAARWTIHPPMTENAPPLVSQIAKHRPSGEPVYVGVRGAPAWLIYSTDWKNPDRARLSWYLPRIGSDGPAFENAAPRSRGAENEGDDLVYVPAHSGPELLGTPTGRQSIASGFVSPAAEPGWAENESRRIRAAANPTISLFFSHVDRTQDELLAAVRRDGGKLVWHGSEDGADAYRFRF